jgi:cyclopropane fatty-acyl-phospholipid synthase-like methyltransferase
MEIGVWRHLPAALRSGEPLPMSQGSEEREATYAGIADDLARLSEDAARRLAAELEVSSGRILDAGCGSGVWSLALARANPEIRVVGLDLPAVLERFRDRARRMGLEDRAEGVAADLHEAELAAGSYELVIAANLLRLEGRSRARELLSRLAEAVADGGALVVVDALREPDLRSRRLHAAYRLHLALRNGTGDTLEAAELESWLRAEGLIPERRIGLGTGGLPGAILGRRS